MIDFIKENWSYIVSGLFAIIVVASAIVKMTPSTKDEGVLAKIVQFLDHFSIAKTARDKKLIEVAEDILDQEKKEG